MSANQDQIELWNTRSGPTWVEMQPVLDGMLAPFSALLVNEALPRNGGSVLDVGCGAGATTFAMAERLGAAGKCVGVDISEPLLVAAKARAGAEKLSTVEFVRADAQTYAFEPESFDAVISRFGVMFFDNPAAAFANIRRAVRKSGKLAFVAWRSPADNPFMTAAKRAAERLLPNMPKLDPNAPGQFAFADAERVRQILQKSGWRGVVIKPIDVEGSAVEADLYDYVIKLGPVGMALQEVDEATRARVIEVVRNAFQSYIQNGTARFNMACWLVTAAG